jgi:hypothetical protein
MQNVTFKNGFYHFIYLLSKLLFFKLNYTQNIFIGMFEKITPILNSRNFKILENSIPKVQLFFHFI